MKKPLPLLKPCETTLISNNEKSQRVLHWLLQMMIRLHFLSWEVRNLSKFLFYTNKLVVLSHSIRS